MSSSSIDPLVVLAEDLEQSNLEIALDSIRHLHVVASALGPHATRQRLIPYLARYCGLTEEPVEEETISPVDRVCSDEALAEVAEQLGSMLDVVGGALESQALLEILSRLCKAHETAVRVSASNSIGRLLPSLTHEATCVKSAMDLTRSLVSGALFSSRCSASSVLCALYTALPSSAVEQKTLLRSMYSTLCRDEVPMVRKAAYAVMGRMAVAVGAPICKMEFGASIKAMQEETQDGIRGFIVDTVVSMAETFSEADFEEQGYPLITQSRSEISWRIRRNLAGSLERIASTAGPKTANSVVLSSLGILLEDTQPEVRLATIECLDNLSKHVESAQFTAVLSKSLPALTVDGFVDCRIALSKIIVDLAAAAGKKQALELFLPVVLSFMENESPLIRENVMGKLDQLVTCIGPSEAVKSVLPRVVALSQDEKWRVRAFALQYLAGVADTIGSDTFSKKYLKLYLDAFGDHVFAVRDESAKQICNLVSKLGESWVVSHLLPNLSEIYTTNRNYLHRAVTLRVCKNLCEIDNLTPGFVEASLLPLVALGVKDPIANVRIGCVHALSACTSHLGGKSSTLVLPYLQKLSSDSDVDVAYFAAQAQAVLV